MNINEAEHKFVSTIISGPCKVCGDVNYDLSFGGPDVCPACDCLPPCPRCKILIEKIKRLTQAEEIKNEFGTLVSTGKVWQIKDETK